MNNNLKKKENLFSKIKNIENSIDKSFYESITEYKDIKIIATFTPTTFRSVDRDRMVFF